MWFGTVRGHIMEPFCFAENTITASIYWSMLQLLVLPPINGIEQEDECEILFQQDGARPQIQSCGRKYQNVIFPVQWIGRSEPTPAKSGLLTTNFFLWDL
jgi:hypothetical protein